MQRRSFFAGVLAVSAASISASLRVLADEVDALPTGGGGTPPMVETVVEVAPGDGTPFGDITLDGGLTRLFAGYKTGNTNGGNASKKGACSWAYAGLSWTTPKRIDGIKVYGTSDVGLWHSGTPSIAHRVFAKAGAAPANPTDGTIIGTATVTDANGIVVSVASTDKATAFNHVWVDFTQSGSGNFWIAGIAVNEIILTAEPPQVAAIISPTPLRVYQQTSGSADVEVNWRGPTDTVRLRRVSDGAVVAENATGIFPSVAAGWYEVSLVRNGVEIDKVKTGVGDVYLVAGQSNAVSVVQPETWNPAEPSAPGKVIISALKGEQRHTLIDRAVTPFNPPAREPGAAWIYTGIALNRSYPVMFVNCAAGNTSVGQWAGAGGLVSRLYEDLARYRPKAIIWLQGESDSMAGTSQSSYFASLNSMVDGANKVAPGTPWVVGINSFRPSYAPVRAAQQQVIDAWAHVHAGPDCDPFRNSSEPAEYFGDDIRLAGEAFAASLIAHGL